MKEEVLKKPIGDEKQADCCATSSCCGSESNIEDIDDSSEKDINCC